MKKKLLPYFLPLFSFILTESNVTLAQEARFSTQKFLIEKAFSVNPLEKKEDWMPQLLNLEMPSPGSERGKLMKIKEESRKIFPLKKTAESNREQSELIPGPMVLNGFEANVYNNSVPNDNNLAISKDGKLVSVSNTTIRGYDIISDSLLFSTALNTFALPLGITGANNSKYDPKALYDPENDRFIVVFLNGTSPTFSKIILAFSSTGNPADSWNLYYLTGNPLNDTTWSDYPAIAITGGELFITVNQIIPGLPWQTGFSQSLIWQIDKMAGFAGDSLLNATLWKNIRFGDGPIRNLNPVGGGSRIYGPNMFLLSNRNFAIQNDTVFIVEITGPQEDPSSTLKINFALTDVTYGVPPAARQFGGHTFDTNDGRILGGFLENDKIQFVSNTIDTNTGLAAVYHGIISNLYGSTSIKGKIIGDTAMDFGYPNISYSGKQGCDNEALITFNHTSPAVFSGFSAVFFSNAGKYSESLKVKEGDNYVNILSGVYERWGDYSGSQRKYNEPGKVWAVGSFGNAQRRNATWVAELQSPDSTRMSIGIAGSRDVSFFNFSDGYAIAEASGGNEPYSYHWSNGSTREFAIGLGEGIHYVTVTDNYQCAFSDSVEIRMPPPLATVFPNPSRDFTTVNFVLEKDELISVSVFNMEGKLVKVLLEEAAKQGRNLFSFSTRPLPAGTYFLKISASDRIILSEKIFSM